MADSERIGPYRVLERLGSGGMGEVVLAHDDRLDRLVAIKRLHDKHADAHHSRERFRREARIVARLNHPAIVQLHDVLRQGDHDFLIMEYVEGRTLRARRDAGPMTVSELLGIAHQIALGMAAAHELGVIHRDLKSENVLITRAGRAKITDFGIAKLHGDENLTADEAVIGTFRSMSPEQALGRPVDHRSDLFSFGILLYETLAGESPFHADSPFLTVQRLVNDEPRPIAEVVPGIPDELARLIHQLLAKEPVLRPRDFHEVADALIELAGHACDTPCHAGPSLGHRSSRAGGDTRPTDESMAPSVPWPTGDTAPLSGRTGDAASLLEPVPAASDAAPAFEHARASGDAAPRSGPAGATDDGPPVFKRMRASGPDLALRPAARHDGPTRAHVDRRRRLWQAAGVGLAVITTLGIGVAVRDAMQLREPARAPYRRVAVLAPHVSDAADRPAVALLAIAIRNAAMADVRGRVGLDLVPRGDIEIYVEGATRDIGRPPTQSEIRIAVGADEILTTDMTCLPDSCTVTLERNTGAPGGPPPESFQLAADAAGRPAETVAFHVSRLYPDHPARSATALGSIDPADHGRFVKLVENYWAGGDARFSADLLAQLEDIRAHSPRSLDVLLFEAEVLRHRYLQTENRAEVERAMDLLRGADQLFPDAYDILSARFDLVLSARRAEDPRALREASAVLDRLVTLDPDSSTTHLQRAKLLAARGELGQASREIDAAVGRSAFSWRVLYHRALVSRQLGDRVATRKAIAELLARSPGNYGGLSLLAREERVSGRLACAAQIYEGLVAREPLYDECAWLAYTRYQLGRYREASDGFRCALAIRPDDTASRLNLAESLLIAGDTEGGGDQLRKLHELLVRKRRASTGATLSFPDLLVDAQDLAHLGRSDRAMADQARERVSQLLVPPARPEAVYTAAVVHAVLGDRDLAARYVTQYLDRENSATDFAFPWFDDLRRDPALGTRLKVAPVAQTCEPSASP